MGIFNIFATWDGQSELNFLVYEIFLNLRAKKTFITSRDIESLMQSKAYIGCGSPSLTKKKAMTLVEM